MNPRNYLSFLTTLSLLLLIPSLNACSSVRSFYESLSKVAASEASAPLSPEQLQQIAQAIVVKVYAGNAEGSGILIAEKDQTYTLVTNAHVTSRGNAYRIQTSDGKTHTATLTKAGDSFGGEDLALLQFKSPNKYTLASFADAADLAKIRIVYAAGYPFESDRLHFTTGTLSILPDKPLVGGYQIGFTNETRQGMSGGSLLNEQGKLVGVLGQGSEPILSEAYTFQDGSQPSKEDLQKMRDSSWAVPVATVTKMMPQQATVAATPSPQQSKAYTGVVAKIDAIAQKVTVRIDSTKSGNGSGAIIARDGNTYYVLTAAHVVKNPDSYKIVTPDGQSYPLDNQTMILEGVDLALVQFTSQKAYSVATLGNYQTKSLENPLVFLSGFPGIKSGSGEPTRRLTVGTTVEQTFLPLSVKESASLVNGYEMVYSNLSLPGMSGGPVFDRNGRVIGINAAAEAEFEITDAGEAQEIYLGYSLGVPVQTFLGQLAKTNLNSKLLKIETSAPSSSSQGETQRVFNSLPKESAPSESASAIDWLNYGNYLWRLQKNTEAVQAFERAIQLKPDFSQAYYALGSALRGQQQTQAALEAYAKATQINPDFYQAWRERSSLLEAQENYSEALASIDKAIAIQPDDAFLYLQRAKILSSQKRFAEATEAYNKSISLKPSYLAYFNRGDARFQLGDFQGAYDDANSAIAMQPEGGLAYYTRGLARNRLKDPQGAIADLSQCIQLMPYLAPAYFARSAIFENLKEYDKSLADLNKIIELVPGYSEAYFQRGSLKATAFNDTQGAIADLSKAIELDPKNAEAYMRRAYIRAEKQGDMQGAVADLGKAIENEPNNPRYYFNRGQLLASLQDFQGAIADYTKVIQLQPDNADAYFRRAAAKSNIKDFPGAKVDLQKAAQLYQAQGNTQQYEQIVNILRMMEERQ
jgi:tetratricopeptide (TPR) repeat protein/S1-C subfamily serine protease